MSRVVNVLRSASAQTHYVVIVGKHYNMYNACIYKQTTQMKLSPSPT